MTRRHRPKRWNTPRARNRDVLGLISSVEVLKDLWPQGGALQRPPWAKAAKARGWMTARAYYALPKSEWVKTKDPMHRVSYGDYPLFGLLRKSA
jgi:hypothetical protein